jgi:hypothetical protein
MDPANTWLTILSALEGDWISESLTADGKKEIRRIHYRWLFNGNFFDGTSEKETDAGRSNLRITYFYDFAMQQIKARTIASDGSSSEAIVQEYSDKIVLQSRGPTPDGELMSLKSTLQLGNPRIEAYSKIFIDGTSVPNPSPIQWFRP